MKQNHPLSKTRVYDILAALLLILLLIVWAAALHITAPSRELTAAQKRLYASARVTDVLEDNAEAQDWTEGRRLGTQYLELEILTGPYRGEILETYNFLSAYANPDAKVGTRLVVGLDYDDDGNIMVSFVQGYDRIPMLIGICVLFALLLVLIGRKKGLMALLGLAYTIAAVIFLMIPMLMRGADPVWTAIAIVALTTMASLILLTGLSRKTLCATLGCIGGVLVAGLLSMAAGALSPLNGFHMGEAEELVLRRGESGLQISGLFVAGILISSLGAVMDVAMSIASASQELLDVNPALGKKQIFRSAMNIGRDAMGTMANTLILAFAGSSLNTLLLVDVLGYSLRMVFNSDVIVMEIVRGMAGSVGIILTVPLVAALSAAILKSEQPRMASSPAPVQKKKGK